MVHNRLNIIQVDPSSDPLTKEDRYISSRLTRKKELQAKFERLWLLNPEQFNPLRNCMQRERLERTWHLILTHHSLQQAYVADIGCAAGVFSRRLRDAGAQVDAIDIAENALKYVRKHDLHHIITRQEIMPTTSLEDDSYDLVVCTEVIADLSPDDFRLFFAELSRVVKAEGNVVFSTPIDINTQGGVERLINLAHTEFDMIEFVPSYHTLYLRIKHLLKGPSYFIKGWQNKDFRSQQLAKRSGLGYWFFRVNTTFLFIWFWIVLRFLFSPLLSWMKSSRFLLLKLEKVCQFFWADEGISHVIFLAKRRPVRLPEPEISTNERPKKKEIWE